MMKCILFYFAILITVSTFSQPVPPVRTEVCPAITEVPVMDGLDNERFWSPEQDFTIFSLSAEADWTGEADFLPMMKFAWAWSFFYTYVHITDEADHSWDGTNGNAWEFDNVEWFFQLDTQTVPTTYTDNTIQFRFNRGNAGFQSSTFRNGITEEDFLWYSENTQDGWVLECAIPWMNIMPVGSLPDDILDWIKEGSIIGFDLACADSDGTDPLVGDRANGTQAAWDEDGEPGDIYDGTEDNAWNNTSVFGYLYLSYKPVPQPDAILKYHPDVYNSETTMFPNPVDNLINLSSASTYSQIRIYSSAGEMVLYHVITSLSIDISSLKPGLYIAVFDDTDTFKFIKE